MKTISVPIAVVELKTENHFSDFFDSDFRFTNLGLWNYTENFDETLTILLAQADYNQIENVELSTTSRRGDFILSVISDLEDEGFGEDVINCIIKHSKYISDKKLIEVFSLNEVAANFNPEVFHFNEVLHAYQHSRDKLLILLLSIFFESHVRELIDEHF